MGSRHCIQKWPAVEETGQAVSGMYEGVIITGISAYLPLSGGARKREPLPILSYEGEGELSRLIFVSYSAKMAI